LEELSNQAVAILLVSMRLVPTLSFAPPFTLVRIPATVRVLLAIALSAWLVAGHPEQSYRADFWSHGLFLTALGELVLGIGSALALQLAFAALQTAGRAIDIQGGFGLAVLVDPARCSSRPAGPPIFSPSGRPRSNACRLAPRPSAATSACSPPISRACSPWHSELAA
jgi:flagellar biosynthetic protein FliR